jgi:hypothetical protein
MEFPFAMVGQKVPVMITVSDGVLSDSWVINVTISSDHPPELVTAAPDHSFLEDNPIDYPVVGHINDFFTDEDGDPLTYLAFASSKNVTVEVVSEDGGLSIAFVTDENWYGLANLTFRATDDEGALAETTIVLSVKSVPDQPLLSLPETFTVDQGVHSLLEVAQNVTDPDSVSADFRWSIDCAYLEYVAIHGGIVVFDFPEDFLDDGEDSKVITVTITVADQDNLVSTDTMTLTVVKHETAGKQSPVLLISLLASTVAVGLLTAYVIARRKKPFVVRDMMLIHNDGFLISRLAHRMVGEIDDNILSGMLTAVLNFVEDSMATSTEGLKTFGFEEYQVLVHRGQKVFAAVVFEGDLPESVDSSLKEFLETTEKVYRKKIANWTGDIETDFAGVDVLINAWVKEHSRGHGKKKASSPWIHKEPPAQPEQQPAEAQAK